MGAITKNVLSVLIVIEDDQLFYDLTETLADHSCDQLKIERAANDETALTLVYTNRYDVCIIRHSETNNSGIQLILPIRKKDISVPIIVISDDDSIETDTQAQAAGASDFIPLKECTPARLERSIRYSCSHAESSLEKAELLAQISSHEKQVSLGGLAIGMAHEINNPLAGSLQSCQNIMRRLDPERDSNCTIAKECGTSIEKIRLYFSKRGIFDFLDRMSASGKRISDVVSTILKFWSNGNSEFTFIDLKKLIQTIAENSCTKMSLVNDCSENGVRIDYTFPEFLPRIEGIHEEIVYVIESIITNALYEMTHERFQELFTPESLAIPLAERYRPPAPSQETKPQGQLKLSITAGITDKGHILLSFEDNGPGIPAHIIHRVFEPFFTTTRTGKTGLGLAIAYYIVANTHKGHIRVSSEYGIGTTFYVELPIIQSFDRFKGGTKRKSHLITTSSEAHS